MNLKCDSEVENTYKIRRKRHIDRENNCIRITNKSSRKKSGYNNVIY